MHLETATRLALAATVALFVTAEIGALAALARRARTGVGWRALLTEVVWTLAPAAILAATLWVLASPPAVRAATLPLPPTAGESAP